MVTEIELFEAPDPTPLDFCLLCWMKSESYKRNVDTRDEIPDCILGVGARLKEGEDQLRRRTLELQSALRLTGVRGDAFD